MRRSAFRGLALTLAISAFAPSAAAREPVARPIDVRDTHRLEARPRGARRTVRIVDNAYRPPTITIFRFHSVRWVNRGANDHTITATWNRWSSETLAPGDAFHRYFRHTGTYRYHCTIHPSMRGTIFVERQLG